MKCNHCGMEIPDNSVICPECCAPVNETLPSGELSKPRNVPLGILGAVIGALIGGASIVLLGQMGYVASISGIILAFCTLKGYELLGGKLDIVGMVISGILIVVMPFCAYLVNNSILLINELAELAPGLTIFEGIQLMFEMAQVDQELLSALTSEVLMLYLFTGIGVVGYLTSKKKAKK